MNTNRPSSARDYAIALCIAVSVAVFLGLYLSIRRGFFFDGPPSADAFYLPNKVLAATGVLLLGLTFLIGPITRYFDRFDLWLGYRKEIGIVGGILVLAHGLGSLFLLPLKFGSPLEYIEWDLTAFGAGILGAILLAFLYLISFQKMMTLVGAARWWFLQRWGLRVVIVLTVVHVAGLKWAGWWKWFTLGSPQTAELFRPEMAPASLIVSVFVAWVILMRLYESLFLFRSAGLTTKEISMDPILRARGRRFFIFSFWTMLVVLVMVLTRGYFIS